MVVSENITRPEKPGWPNLILIEQSGAKREIPQPSPL